MSDVPEEHDAGGSSPLLGAADVDALLREVMGRVHGALDGQVRWELLLDAVVSIGADLTLDGLLERIVAVAGRLVGARYAALGVLDSGSERRLRTFVHHGFETEQVVRIGELPSGHGLLGLLIDRPEPLRLHDIAAHPASYGFPPGHPPMSSFLGVPVRTRGRVFGNLYLTEKEGGGDFTAEDERIVVALAAAAGVAVENARLYEDVRRRERWLAATAEITAVLLGEVRGTDALQLVADRARELSGADVVWIVSGDGDAGASGQDTLRLRAVSGASIDLEDLHELSLVGSLAEQVAASGLPTSVPDLMSDPRATLAASIPGWPRLGPAILVPLTAAGHLPGVLALGWVPGGSDPHLALDPSLPAAFAEQAALCLQVSRSQQDRQRLAVFEDRDRIGRDLHDLVIQRLFATGLALQGATRVDDLGEVRRRLETAVDDLDDTVRDIRHTIFELGAAGTGVDLRAEVARLVRRAGATLKFAPGLSIEGPISSALTADESADVLAVLSEALSNAARHAGASRVDVALSAGKELVLEVVDDGRGIAPGVAESGLRNLRQRAERRGGLCEVSAGAGGGTRMRWSVPLERAVAGS